MKRKKTSKAGVKQTSTPLNDNEGLASSFKSFPNVSTIRNEYKVIRRPVIESPTILDWKSSPKSPKITERYEKVSIQKINKQRRDTPLKSQRSSQFPYASAVRPLKLRFSRLSSSSNINSKLSDIKRRNSIVDKHLLYTGEKPENKIEEIVGKQFWKNTDYDNDVVDSAVDKFSKKYLHKQNTESFGSYSKKKCLLQKEYKHEVLENFYKDFFGDSESMTDVTGSELLCTSDSIESCRKESSNSIASNIVDYLSGSDVLSDDYIASSFMEQNKGNWEYSDNDVISSENNKNYLQGKPNANPKKNNVNFIESPPETNASLGFDSCTSGKDAILLERCKIFSKVSTEIGIGKLDHSKLKDDIIDGPQSMLPTPLVEKETRIGCNLNLDGRVPEKVDEKKGKKPKKSRKKRFKRNGKQETDNDDLGRNVDMQTGILKPPSDCITQIAVNESFDKMREKAQRGNCKRKRKTCKNPEAYQGKSVTVSNNLENKTNSSDVWQLNDSKGSNKYITEIIGDRNEAGINEINIENGKQSRTKSKRKQEKKIDKARSKGFAEEPIPDSNNIQCDSVQRKAKIFKKPSTVKKNIISKRNLMNKGRKTKMTCLYPPTSTPFDSPAAANEKLPLMFESLSPVGSSKRRDKSYSLDDIQIAGIKVKKTYAKTNKIYPKFDKGTSKWESFRKKPSYQRKNNNYVSDTNFSKSSGSIHLFESPPMIVNEGIPVDDILLHWNRSRKSKASERRSKQHETNDATESEKVNSKKWFETTKLKKLADHFNEISEVSLVIEKKNKNRKKKSEERFTKNMKSRIAK